MPQRNDDSVPTRSSLLRRIRNSQDQVSWQDFYDTYKRIVRGLALKAGLGEAEAADVVQETFIEMAKIIPEFQYDPKRGSFRAYLKNRTRWRILDHLRKRARENSPHNHSEGDAATTETLEHVPDPASIDLDALWQQEWELNLMRAAIETVRRKADVEKFQIFDLCTNKECPPQQVAAAYNIPVQQVYLAKHRVSQMIKAEVRRLERRMQ